MSALIRVALGLMLLLTALNAPVRARADSLVTDATFSLDGLTMTVTSCHLSFLGAFSTGCAPGEFEANTTVYAGAPGLIVSNVAGNWVNILLDFDQLTFTLSVTGTGISPGTMNMMVHPATSWPASLSLLEEACAFQSVVSSGAGSTASGAGGTAGGVSAFVSRDNSTAVLPLMPYSPLAVTNTLNPPLISGLNGFALWTVEQSFVPAPEPSTLLVLPPAALGLMLLRRHRRGRWRSGMRG